jgi:glycosyltransferase involved in cell wall biosynthesis
VRAVVGVVVPTLGDRPDWLSQTLESIRSQDYPEVRILLVAPEDRLKGLAKRYGADFLLDRAPGLSPALNAGWRALRREVDYWTWLGDDDLLAPGSLRYTSSALDRNPDAMFAYGRTRMIDAGGRSLCLTIPTGFAPIYARYGQDHIPQPGSLIRVRPYRDAENIVDESLRNAMDLDLFLRLARGGRKSWAYVPKEVSAYRVHAGSITNNKGHEDESEKVREAYRSPRLNQLMGKVAGARRLAERLFFKGQWVLTGRKPHSVYYAGRKDDSQHG